MSLINTIHSVLHNLGGWSLAASFLISLLTFIFTFYKEIHNQKWKTKYEKDIVKLKADIDINHSLLNSSISLFSSGYQYSQERRLKAIEIMWNDMLRIRKIASPVILFYTTLLPEEYSAAVNDSYYYFDKKSYNEELLKNTQIVDLQRPFLTEYLWGLYFVYRAFIHRLIWLFISGKQNHNIKPWFEDSYLVDLLQGTISKEDFSKINFTNYNSLNLAINLLEEVILKAVKDLTSGKLASEEALAQSKHLMSVAISEESKYYKDATK